MSLWSFSKNKATLHEGVAQLRIFTTAEHDFIKALGQLSALREPEESGDLVLRGSTNGRHVATRHKRLLAGASCGRVQRHGKKQAVVLTIIVLTIFIRGGRVERLSAGVELKAGT